MKKEETQIFYFIKNAKKKKDLPALYLDFHLGLLLAPQLQQLAHYNSREKVHQTDQNNQFQSQNQSDPRLPLPVQLLSENNKEKC